VTEREWREAIDLQPSRFGLAAVLAAAVVLRFWALGHGIPFAVGVDEPEIMDRAVGAMRSGDFNPRFFDYPGLYIHLQTAVACVRFLAGALDGQWNSLATAPTSAFYLWGRAITALLGVATVWLVFLAGMRWGARHALVAAAIMAVLPAHVRESHYVLTDVPLTFAVTLTLVLSLRAHERATVSALAIAGAAAGLAAATKYNGALAIVMPLLACWMTPAMRPSRLVGALAVIGAAIGGFLVGAPYTILDLPGFLNGFARLANEYRTPTVTPLEAANVYLKHLRTSFAWPGLILIASGLALGTWRLVTGPGRVRWALVIAFAAIYFTFISRQTIIFGRYLLPIFPPLAILAGCAVISGVSLLRRFEIPRAVRTTLILLLTVAAIVPPGVRAIGFTRMISREGTVERAYNWIIASLPQGTAIVVETREMLLPGDRYKTRNIPYLHRQTLEDYRKQGVEYLVASSMRYGPPLDEPHKYPAEYAAYMTIFEQSREVMRFSPSVSIPGPELRIYRIDPDVP
jgi:4-amino-4-deoxy-L-arabinose transferase-like glycosyltransferase